MGYRSEVVIMAVVGNKEHADEVMAVYRMHKDVGEYNIEDRWRRVELDSGPVAMIWEAENVKFYEGYPDVQAATHMRELLRDFEDNRDDFSYAWALARIGEDYDDLVYDLEDGGTDLNLPDIIYENLTIVRRIELDL